MDIVTIRSPVRRTSRRSLLLRLPAPYSLLSTPDSLFPRRHRRAAFTLPELLMVITILALLSSLGFSAYTGAIQLAREQRTRSMIDKIDTLLMERYESYRTRAVPIKIPAGTDPRVAAKARLIALRDLMRMELPDRKYDVIDPPCNYDPTGSGTAYMQSPALRRAYLRRAMRNVNPTALPGAMEMPITYASWSVENQSAECLYLILSTMRDGDKAALDYFSADEIGDTDNDKMPEILDSWGTPIHFIRWPAGYAPEGLDGWPGIAGTDDDGNGVVDDTSELGWPDSDDSVVRTMQTKNYLLAPDPFDPIKVHGPTPGGATPLFTNPYTPGYLLHPLIISAGRDKNFEVIFDTDSQNFRYSPTGTAANYPNPYVRVSVTVAGSAVDVPIGTPADIDGDGTQAYADNVTNHDTTSE